MEREIPQCFNAFTLNFDLGDFCGLGLKKAKRENNSWEFLLSVKSEMKKPSVNHARFRVIVEEWKFNCVGDDMMRIRLYCETQK